MSELHAAQMILYILLIVGNSIRFVYRIINAPKYTKKIGEICFLAYGLISLASIRWLSSTTVGAQILGVQVGITILMIFLRICMEISTEKLNSLMLAMFVISLAAVFGVTIFNRYENSLESIILTPMALTSNKIVIHFIENLILFVPTSLAFGWMNRRKLANPIYAVDLGLLLSVCIESTQLILSMGQCDINDVIANAAGAFVGILVARYIPCPIGKRAISIKL